MLFTPHPYQSRAIDFVLAQLCDLNPDEPIRRGQAYLISCIYNAPVDCLVNQKRAFGR